MKTIIIITIYSTCFIFWAQSIFAHNSWIDFTDTSIAKKNGTITIKLASGHQFPKSNFALKNGIINYCKAHTPDGKEIPIETKREDNIRTGYLKPVINGTYIIVAALKNPPRYFIKSIFTSGKCSRTDLKTGETLEIVPEKCPSALKMGERLVLKLYYNGKAIQSNMTFSIDGRSNFSTSTNKNGEYQLTIRNKGKYLITSSYNGKGCSLTFKIN